MKKQEALNKIAELQKFVEDLDKPKQVRVYIKLDANESEPYGWNPSMNKMLGGVFYVKEKMGRGFQIWTDDEHSDWFNFSESSFVVVEGSLADLKD